MAEIKRKNYKSLSKSEYRLMEFVVENELKVFTREDLEIGLGFTSDKCYRVVSNLRQKDLLESPMRGRYVLDIPNYDVSINQVASKIYWPSYVSFWTALSYHGLTDQLPNTVYVVTSETSGSIEFEDYKIQFVKFKPDYIFGYEETDGFIAEPEKAVIDSLHLPKYSGGIKEISKALDRNLDIKKMTGYAEKTGISAVKKRLKYLLDRKEVENDIDISGSYVKLDPSKGKGKKVEEALVEDNVYDN